MTKTRRVKVVDNSSRREEFKDYLKINPDELDEELIRQPGIFGTVAEEAVLAGAVRDKAKEALATVDAELNVELRKKLEKTEERKPSEAMIANAVLLDKRHAEAQDNYLNAKREADLWFNLKEAFNMRSYMLRDLAGLQVNEAYSSTSVRAPRSEALGRKATAQKAGRAGEIKQRVARNKGKK